MTWKDCQCIVGGNFVSTILIAAIIPHFLEKGRSWFSENTSHILRAAKTQLWWQDNTLFLEKGQAVSISEISRKLDEMGYEKTHVINEAGDFAIRGGVIDIFPINNRSAIRINVWGPVIDSIEILPLESKETEEDLKKRFLKKFKLHEEFSELGKLKRGDLIVHLDHGIARYRGTESKIMIDPERGRTDQELKEYYVLEYAQGDTLWVPVGLERKLSRYVGFTNPQISRLGSQLWTRIKHKIKESAEKLAEELIELYAQRELTSRSPIPWDELFVQGAEHSFAYVETEDQMKAIADIKRDFQQDKPMDRVLVGDVGFGKTEIALRAMVAMIAVGKQVALLCPTTVLAHQHWRTLISRLSNLPISIALLSRLESHRAQKQALKAIENGMCDLVIGTHRLLSRDVKFKNLGLLVIDEEQRFGVRHKETFKKMRANLDVLSLSATPIPRTLYLALASLRDISKVNTPPPHRMAIQTFVMPWNEEIFKKAILFELERKGQTYFLHNRVETIETAKGLIKKLVPHSRIAIAHGRLQEKELIAVMEKLYRHDIDILIATTIIENGLDIPNVNTLIVDDATRLGLSQAHQIRGRIGRSHIQAYAYFLYGEYLTEEAKMRLETLQEYQELGAGYHIAVKDLEMRGAGNILGKEQSGHVNAIGLNLYCQMLADAVEKQKKIKISQEN